MAFDVEEAIEKLEKPRMWKAGFRFFIANNKISIKNQKEFDKKVKEFDERQI